MNKLDYTIGIEEEDKEMLQDLAEKIKIYNLLCTILCILAVVFISLNQVNYESNSKNIKSNKVLIESIKDLKKDLN